MDDTQHAERVLGNWCQPVFIDEDGWACSQSTILFNNSPEYKTVQLLLEFPGWLGIETNRIQVILDKLEPKTFQVTPGYYSLAIPVSVNRARTRLNFICEKQNSMDDGRMRSFRIVSARYSREIFHGPIQVSPCSPGLLAEPDLENQPTSLYQAIAKYEESSLNVNCTGNNRYGTRINFIDKNLSIRTKPLSELRNKFENDCYLVASGPSVGDLNFDAIKDKTFVGVNGSATLMKTNQIKFSVYVVVDPYFAYYNFELLKDSVRSGADCVFSEEVLVLICAMKPELFKTGNLYMLEAIDLQNAGQKVTCNVELPQQSTDIGFGFSKNLEHGYVPGGTVAFTALQICYYMGFKTVFAIGLDFYTRAGKYRFHEQDTSLFSLFSDNLEKTFERDILPAFGLLRQLVTRHNFQVYNLSKDSRLPGKSIPKLSLEQSLDTGKSIPG